MSDFNFDENTVNKLKDMMNKGEFSNMISQIPPEMIQNLSSMFNDNSSNKSSSNSNSSYSGNNSSNTSNLSREWY